MKFGVVVFPGSNCDDDMIHALGDVMHSEVIKIWHKETSLAQFSPNDCIVLPGGFSYGDYLRCGALAGLSPIMAAVKEFASNGGMVIGICNGFQILCESGLLPGALLINENQKFICKNVFLRVENCDTAFTNLTKVGDVLKIPIAHAEGRYYADEAILDKLEANNQVLFRYCGPNGELSQKFNPNGTSRSIAGICNENRNVFGMMPHPERAAENVLGNQDGKILFESLLAMQNQMA
jgi:phosphoribosylformylglycinamidine synthase